VELSDLIGSQPDDDATLRQEWHDGDFVRTTIESFSSRELFSYVRKFWLRIRTLHANENDTFQSSNEHYTSGRGQGCTFSFTSGKARSN
jgi:hypothetical protein